VLGRLRGKVGGFGKRPLEAEGLDRIRITVEVAGDRRYGLRDRNRQLLAEAGA
jgi:hypothetical protein